MNVQSIREYLQPEMERVPERARAVMVKAQIFVSSMSIRTKIAAALVAVLCLAIASLGMVSFRQQKRTLEAEMSARAQTLALQLAAASKTGLLTQDELGAAAAVKDLLKMPGVVSASVLDRKDKVFVSAGAETAGADTLEVAAPVTAKLGEKTLTVGLARVALSRAALAAAIRAQAWSFFWITSGFVLLSLAISFALGKLLTRQILVLMTVMKVVSQGNLNQLAEVDSKDEIGRLAETFNQMILNLREKLHMEKYLSRSTLQMIAKLRDSDKIRLGGERRHVAVLFSDIRGFTSLTETLDPEEVLGLLNIYLNLQAEAIYQRGGVVDKFVGDAVMAIFTGEEPEYQACLASQEIMNFLATLNEARGRQGRRQIQIGIGLNSGTVIMGNMGSERQMDYTAIGDPINTAARLCSVASAGQVVMSQSVAQATGERCARKELAPVTVKGKRDALTIYQLLDVPGAARRHMRRSTDAEAVCRLEGIDDSYPVRLRELSVGGCSFLAPVPLPSGAQVELDLPPAAGASGRVRGVVRHARKRDGGFLAGISFSDVDDQTSLGLVEWVHNVETEVATVSQTTLPAAPGLGLSPA